MSRSARSCIVKGGGAKTGLEGVTISGGEEAVAKVAAG